MEQNIKILVVDDDEEIRLLLKGRLMRENSRFSVESVSSGEECLEYVRDNLVDCIISDHQMGGMDGVTLLESLRKAGHYIPFIFFTGQGNEEIAAQAFRAGAYDYFTKDLMGFAMFARLANSVEQAVRQKLVDEYRIQAEHELASEKRKLEDLLFHLGVGVSIQDRDLRVIYQNSIIVKMAGESVGEFCYRTYEGRESVCEDCPVVKTFEEGKSHRTERSVDTNGRHMTVAIITTPVLGPDGEVVACIEVVEDLTEFKAQEAALRQSELRFRMLFDGANDAIFIADSETGVILDANVKAGEMIGIPRENVIGMHQSKLHPPGELEKAKALFAENAYASSSRLIEINVQRADGGVVPVEISGSAFELGGRIVLQGIFRDITERLKAEEEIRRSDGRYREAEKIAGIGSWDWDIAGDKVHWSDGMFTIFGVSPHNFGKTYQSYLDFVVPEDRERVQGIVAESFKGEAPLEYTTRFIRDDGEVRYLYIYGRATLDGEGNPVRLFGTAQDVTDMRRSEEALKWELSLNRALSGLSAWLIDRTSTIEDMASVTLEYARAMTGSRHGFVSSVEVDEDGGTALELTSMVGNGCSIDDKSRRVEMAASPDGNFKSLCGRVLNTRKPFFTNSPQTRDEAAGVPDGHIEIANFLAVPAMIGENLLGMIALANKDGGYTYDDINTVSKLAEFYSLAIERMNAEKAVRENELLLKTVLSALPDIVFIHDKDGSITNVFHPEGSKLYAFEEEFIGRPLEEVLPEDVAGGAVEAVRRTHDSRKPEVFEYALEIGGLESIFEARLVPFGGDRVLSVVRDVTENRKAGEALRMSEERFRQLADNIDGVPWMMSADRETMYYVGPALEDIWGRNPRELFEDSWAWLQTIHPDDRERVREQVLNTPLERRYSYECRILRPDGGMRWIRNRVFPIVNQMGEVYRLAGIAEDITDEKDLQMRREDLFSMLRHDARTPLSVISGNAEMVAQSNTVSLDGESRGMLNTIRNSAKSLSRMLDDLTAIARLEAGSMPLKTARIDVADLVLEVGANMAAAISEKGHTLIKDLDDGLPPVAVDQNNILRALTNMVQNAVNYTPSGGEICIVARRAKIDGRAAVALSVRDNGLGIPHEDQTRVFEKRYRAANSAGVKGSGFGLAIVKLVAEAHGGSVELESEPGRGSTFRLLLPADA